MYKRKLSRGTILKSKNKPVEGERIEIKIARLLKNKEPLDDGVEVPLIYTERKDGVNAAYNIRTDRFDLAAGVMDKIHKQNIAKRDHKPDLKVVHKEEPKSEDKKDGGAESIQGKAEGDNPQSK